MKNQTDKPTPDEFADSLRALLDDRDRLKSAATVDVLADLPAAGFTIRVYNSPYEPGSDGGSLTLCAKLPDGTVLREKTGTISRHIMDDDIRREVLGAIERLARQLVAEVSIPLIANLLTPRSCR